VSEKRQICLHVWIFYSPQERARPIGFSGKLLIFWRLRAEWLRSRLLAHRVLFRPVQLFVVGRVQLLIANSQVTRPETRTFGYYALGLWFRGFSFQIIPVVPERLGLMRAAQLAIQRREPE
jgi:hypothetical protein